MGELSRRNALLLAGRLTGAAALGGLAVRGGYLALGGPEAAASTRVLDRELRIGYLPITDASALLTAHARGFLADAGLPSAQPVLFRSWESLAQAFLVGEVDVVHLLLPFAVQLKLAKEAPLKVVAWGHTNGSALTVATDVTETAQLEGRRIAVPYWWSIHSILTQRLLVGAGLRPVIGRRPRAGEVELVVMAPAEMVSALASGAVAGYAVADPFNAVAEVKGIGRVHRFLGDVWADHACCGIAVRRTSSTRIPRRWRRWRPGSSGRRPGWTPTAPRPGPCSPTGSCRSPSRPSPRCSPGRRRPTPTSPATPTGAARPWGSPRSRTPATPPSSSGSWPPRPWTATEPSSPDSTRRPSTAVLSTTASSPPRSPGPDAPFPLVRS